MIRGFINDKQRLRVAARPMDQLDELLWLDLIEPTREEEALVEARYGINVPTHEDMAEIEISSRLYRENGAAFMTATLVAQSDSEEPVVAPVSFVLHNHRLITVRYHEPRAFQTFPTRAEQAAVFGDSAEALLIALLDAIVDRIADILERGGLDVDRVSREVFRSETAKRSRARDFQRILAQIGRGGDLVSNIRNSLMSLERLVGFLNLGIAQYGIDQELRSQVETLRDDVHSLIDHADFLSQKITFLLDATLGMITMEQNAIVKIFSIVAVVFLPPTLIASVYGMNFQYLPELDWRLGYPLALSLMVLSAAVSYWYFKRRGWL
jgi:magnesium transporter